MTNQRKYRYRNRIWFLKFLKQHPCIDCGEADPVLLELDHVRGQKTLKVSRFIQGGYSLKRIQEEIAKSVVRCVRCHRIRTARDQEWMKYDA